MTRQKLLPSSYSACALFDFLALVVRLASSERRKRRHNRIWGVSDHQINSAIFAGGNGSNPRLTLPRHSKSSQLIKNASIRESDNLYQTVEPVCSTVGGAHHFVLLYRCFKWSYCDAAMDGGVSFYCVIHLCSGFWRRLPLCRGELYRGTRRRSQQITVDFPVNSWIVG